MLAESDMDRVFGALSHAGRRQIRDHLRNRPGISVRERAAKYDVTRIAVMNHLKVLQDADFVISEKDGRTRRLSLNAVPIQAIDERWTDDFSAHDSVPPLT